MLFNSPEYIFLFFPVVALFYFFLNSKQQWRTASIWLVIASLFFYGYWNPKYIVLIVLSIGFNFLLGESLQKNSRKLILTIGIVLNLGFLAYYKYANFVVDNINLFLANPIQLAKIELPLAISFFTFLQIAYLVDCYQRKVKETNFVHYALFVTYFPHLIAGPLVHHQELMPEFSVAENKKIHWNNIFRGLCIFSIGLFKKVFIADSFAEWARMGFDSSGTLGFVDAWGSSLSYTLQLYFDFSGYTDMAIGASIILNIKLPINFNSPYKALDIQDFWRRWHMTLSRWLREYLYIPLGGNRNGSFFTGINLMITFLLGGLWHGASWNFVIWGALHGFAVTAHRIWHTTGVRLPRSLAWFMTFMYVNIAWVFFRAKTLPDSLRMLEAMTDISSFSISGSFATTFNYLFSFSFIPLLARGSELLLPVTCLLYLLVFFPLCLLAPNTSEIDQRLARADFKPTLRWCTWIAILAGIPLYQMLFMSSRISEFIYFNF